MNIIINFFEENFTNQMAIFFLSMFPLIELKGAIPLGISLGLGYFESTIISYIGSMLPVPLIFFTIRKIFKFLHRYDFYDKLVNKLVDRTLKKGDRIKKKGLLGLFIFVAIPLPGTGIWSGTLIANLLDIRFKHAFITIALGNMVAGVIIFFISSGIIKIFDF